MKTVVALLALWLAAAAPAVSAQDNPANNPMPRELIETGIQQIAKACVRQWATHGEAKAAAFCECVNADDIAAIRKVKTVGDMDNWILAAHQEAKLHEAGDPKVTALFQQRFDRCEPRLR
jgi:hypothetical protein